MVLILIIIGALGFLLTQKKGVSSAELFSQAEAFYEKGDYVNALSLYQEIKTQFPKDPLIKVVDRRIEEVKAKIEEARKTQEKLEQHLKAILERAQEAYQKRRFLKPENDNAIGYINQILALEPNYQPALELRDKIVQYFRTQAKEAEAKQQYDRAIQMYKNILQIIPDDAETLNAFNMVLGLNQYNQIQSTYSKLARTEKELQRLRSMLTEEQKKRKEQEAKLKSLVQKSEPSPLASAVTTTPDKATKPVEEAPAPAPTPAPAATSPPAPKPAKSTSTTAVAPTPTPAPAPVKETPTAKSTRKSPVIPLVLEPLIDGGKRQYIHKETPVVPATWHISKTERVRAECIVGVDGRVEKVRVLQPASQERLTKLAVEALKKYRYKPATRNGSPVRFKVVELIVFK